VARTDDPLLDLFLPGWRSCHLARRACVVRHACCGWALCSYRWAPRHSLKFHAHGLFLWAHFSGWV